MDASGPTQPETAEGEPSRGAFLSPDLPSWAALAALEIEHLRMGREVSGAGGQAGADALRALRERLAQAAEAMCSRKSGTTRCPVMLSLLKETVSEWRKAPLVTVELLGRAVQELSGLLTPEVIENLPSVHAVALRDFLLALSKRAHEALGSPQLRRCA